MEELQLSWLHRSNNEGSIMKPSMLLRCIKLLLTTMWEILGSPNLVQMSQTGSSKDRHNEVNSAGQCLLYDR